MRLPEYIEQPDDVSASYTGTLYFGFGHRAPAGYDFEKLLLARTGFRLMIFTGSNQAKSEEIAELLVRKVREFKGSRAEDAWLLAAWEGSNDDWWFRYFTIEMNAAIPFLPPSRG